MNSSTCRKLDSAEANFALMAVECSDSNILRPLKCVSTREEHIIRAVDLSIAELTAEKSLGGTKKDMTQKRYCLNSSETPLKA